MKRITNQNGQGLIETLLALGIGSIICVTALMSIFLIVKASRYAQYSAESKSEAETLADTLSKYLSHGVEVDWTSAPISDITSRGRLRTFHSRLRVQERAPTLVAAYLREAGRPSTANPESDIRATAIFFSEPTFDTPGRVFLATSDRGETGNISFSTDRAQLVFENIVEFEISPTGLFLGAGTAVRAAEVRFVYRKFLDPDRSGWKWCPRSEMARPRCRLGVAAKDKEIKLVIPFYNNAIESTRRVATSTGPEAFKETILGDAYLFTMDTAQ